MRLRYVLVTSVVCQKFVPKQCVVCRLELFHLWFYIFCSNVFGFYNFVANRMIFRATCSMRFLLFLSTIRCTPLYLMLSLFLASSIGFEYAPVSGCVGECLFVCVLGSGLSF